MTEKPKKKLLKPSKDALRVLDASDLKAVSGGDDIPIIICQAPVTTTYVPVPTKPVPPVKGG